MGQNENLNKALHDYFDASKKQQEMIADFAKNLIIELRHMNNSLDMLALNTKIVFTRDDVQRITPYSRTTVAGIFHDPELTVAELGRAEIVTRENLECYFSEPRSRHNSSHWKKSA